MNRPRSAAALLEQVSERLDLEASAEIQQTPIHAFTRALHAALDRLSALGTWPQPEEALAAGRAADQRLDAAARRLDLPGAQEALPGVMAELGRWERTWAGLHPANTAPAGARGETP